MSPYASGQFTDGVDKVVAGAPPPMSCPFCGSGADQLVVERWSEEGDPDPAYHVNCLHCDGYGPEAPTALAAALAWNGRKTT